MRKGVLGAALAAGVSAMVFVPVQAQAQRAVLGGIAGGILGGIIAGSIIAHSRPAPVYRPRRVVVVRPAPRRVVVAQRAPIADVPKGVAMIDASADPFARARTASNGVVPVSATH